MTRPPPPPVFRLALAACVGLALAGLFARDESVPMPAAPRPATPPASRQDAAARAHGEDDDQPAGACWRTDDIAGVPGSCLCSAGSVEDLLTPDFMRAMLTSWRDTGHLSTGEWRQRLREVDAACRPRAPAP